MSVIIETSIGDVIVDLYTDERPRCCMNFLKLCKIKYYNFSLFHTVQQNVVAQSGDPTASGRGGESIYGILYGDQARFFDMEVIPQIKHLKKGLVSMVNNGSGMHGSQFFFTLADNLDYLDGKHTVFGEVAEGFDVLDKLNNTFCGEDNRPHQDIRVYHTVILDDPFKDPSGLEIPAMSPGPTEEMLNSDHIPCDANIDEDKDKTEEELMEMMAEKEAKANTQILEMVGDLPEAEVAPPENVLFVCKLNPVTTAEDLEIIFSRFGPIVNCEVIKDTKTGESLQYAFVEFEKQEHCESAYFKMDNVLIDDRRIHVDFSQSVSKLKWKGKGKGVEILPTGDAPVYVLKNQQRQNDGYELVYDHDEENSRTNKKQKTKSNNRSDEGAAERFDRANKQVRRSRSASPDVRKRNEDPRSSSRREDRQKDYRDRAGVKGRERGDYSDRRGREDKNTRRRDDGDEARKRKGDESRLRGKEDRGREDRNDRRDERNRVERRYNDKESERREQRSRGYDDRDDGGRNRNKSNGREGRGKRANSSDESGTDTKKRYSSKRANSSDESEPEAKKLYPSKKDNFSNRSQTVAKKSYPSKKVNSSDESEPEAKKHHSSKRANSREESDTETKKRHSSKRANSSDESDTETKKRHSSKKANSSDESDTETKKRHSSKRANSSDESEPEAKKRYPSKRGNSSDDSDQETKKKRKEKKKRSNDKDKDSDSTHKADKKSSSAVKKKKKSKKKHKSRNHSSSSSEH